jgi:hypothetical protein
MQPGANDARQLVYKWTEASQTIRGGYGVCGEDGDESKRQRANVATPLVGELTNCSGRKEVRK